MEKIHWIDDEEPALEAANLNQMQDNIESAIKDVDNKATGVINDVDIANIKNEIINVDDAMDYDAKLNFLGNLEQNTYEGKNLLDTSVIETQLASGVQITRYNDGSINLNGTSTSGITLSKELKVPIKLIANQNYILSTKNKLSSNIEALYLRDENDVAVFTVPSTANSASLTPTENKTIKYIRIYIQNGQKINLTLYPQLEVNNVETDYEPYVGAMRSPNYKYPQSINTVTKNNTIIKSNKNALTSYIVSNTKSAYLNIFEGKGLIQPGKTYTLSFTSNEAGNQYYLNEHIFTTSPRIVTKLGRNEITATTKDVIDTNDLSVYNETRGYTFLKNAKAQTNNISIINPMLEIGEKASNYVKHLEDTYPLNLKKLELCKIGDYQDTIYKEGEKWYKNARIGSYKFTGNERAYSLTTNSGFNIFSLGQFINDMLINNDLIMGKCNRFRVVAWKDRYHENDMYLLDQSNMTVRFVTNDFSSNEEFLQFLKDNETILKYVKIEPTKEEITDENLIKQLNALDKFKTFEGSNTIYSIADLPPILDLTYYRSNKIRIQKLEQQVQKLLAAQITNNESTQSDSNIPNELS